tara:strand:+ start:1041 stop:1169 length:129 start_codon:yes stop_codon:yes gene_type:complete
VADYESLNPDEQVSFNGLLGEWQGKQVPYTESFPSLRPAAAK